MKPPNTLVWIGLCFWFATVVYGQPFPAVKSVNTPPGSGLQGGGPGPDINLTLLTTCPDGQTLKWSGGAWVCTPFLGSVTAGFGLKGGGSGNPTLSIDTSIVPQLGAANVFTALNTFNAGLTADTTTGITGLGQQTSSSKSSGFPWTAAIYGHKEPSSTFTMDAGGFFQSDGGGTGSIGYSSVGGTGVIGEAHGNASNNATGVFGYATSPNLGAAQGVHGVVDFGNGVRGDANMGGTGVQGNAYGFGQYGVDGQAFGQAGIGVHGVASSSGTGVRGEANPFEKPCTLDFNSTPPSNCIGGWFSSLGSQAVAIYSRAFPADAIGLYVDGNGFMNGHFTITGCSAIGGATIGVNCQSDARLKKNIRPFQAVLDKLVRLQPVSFDWRVEEFPEKRFPKDHTFGLIAQDVEPVMPELVSTGDDGFKGVNYAILPYLMLQAIRELKAENDRLAQQLNRQEVVIRQLSEQLRPSPAANR